MAPATFLLAILAQIPPTSAGEKFNLVVVSRSIDQDQGGWLVSYRLQYHGSPMDVRSTEMIASLDGDVSNSRLPGHAVPRRARIVATGLNRLCGSTHLISGVYESQCCQERATIAVWTGDGTAPEMTIQSVVSLRPGTVIRLQLRLDHLHEVYGDYDPLLGIRQLEVHLGTAVLRDTLAMDREQQLAQAIGDWVPAPEERRDCQFFHSAPDSIFLDATTPGFHFYAFGDRPVRYSQKMRLRFWYYLAHGSDGEAYVRFRQFKDVPSEWKVVQEGGYEERLGVEGKWMQVEKIFRTESEATELGLNFRLTGDVALMWIDDVTFEPIGVAPPHGP